MSIIDKQRITAVSTLELPLHWRVFGAAIELVGALNQQRMHLVGFTHHGHHAVGGCLPSVGNERIAERLEGYRRCA